MNHFLHFSLKKVTPGYSGRISLFPVCLSAVADAIADMIADTIAGAKNAGIASHGERRALPGRLHAQPAPRGWGLVPITHRFDLFPALRQLARVLVIRIWHM